MYKFDLTKFKELKGVTELDKYCSEVDDEASLAEKGSYFCDIVLVIGALGVLFLLVIFTGFLVSFFLENPKFLLVLLGVVGFFSLLGCVKNGLDHCETEVCHFRISKSQ